MKKLYLFFTIATMGLSVFAQAPQGINYQTVVRDGDGQLLADATVILRMTILLGISGGAAVYSETHTKVTNPFGLVNLIIGQGTPIIGNFSDVNWGKSVYYLETAVDLTGSGQYGVLGVTQFVSVPYSLYSGLAGGILTMSQQERNALQNPPVGMQIYNSTTNCLNYFNGTDWYETCGTLVVNQSPDVPVLVEPLQGSIILPPEVTLSWECSDPDLDPLHYDLLLMANGLPILSEAGLTAKSYTVSLLENITPYSWKVVAYDDHGNQTEGPFWLFITADCSSQQAYAGADGTTCDFSEYQIQGANTGLWMNVQWSTSGDGYFNDATMVNPIYTPGMLDNESDTVVLSLTSYPNPPCTNPPGFDQMNLIIQHYPTVNAGPDRTLCEGDVVNLTAVAENYDEIQWVTYTGSGTFENGNALNTIYYPGSDEWSNGFSQVAILVSEIEPCTVSAADVVDIEYYPYPLSDAGYDQLNVAGTSTNLLGNAPPEGGHGEWTILDGTGGIIAEPSNPGSQFTGVSGNTYTLQWTLYSVFGCSDGDEVTIVFAPAWSCGQSFTDDRDGKVYTTLQLGTQCWMKQNLNIGTRIAGTSNQTNNGTIEKYCYNNTESNCTTYGGLYQWNEMMQYTTTAGVKGICPTGWHLPTDAEWTTLTTYVSSQTSNRCNSNVVYIAKSLAATTNWNTYTGTCAIGDNLAANNATGFTGLPGGYRYQNGSFDYVGYYGFWWSSTQYIFTGYYRALYYDYAEVSGTYGSIEMGYSVRCLRD